MDDYTYVATIEITDENDRVCCGGCEWEGTVKDGLDIEDAILTPGDASPACRCPEDDCGALCYPEPMTADAAITAFGLSVEQWDALSDKAKRRLRRDE